MSDPLPARGSRFWPLPSRFRSGARVVAILAPVVGDRLLLAAVPGFLGLVWVRA